MKKGIRGAKHPTVADILLTPWHVSAPGMFLQDPTGHIRNKGMQEHSSAWKIRQELVLLRPALAPTQISSALYTPGQLVKQKCPRAKPIYIFLVSVSPSLWDCEPQWTSPCTLIFDCHWRYSVPFTEYFHAFALEGLISLAMKTWHPLRNYIGQLFFTCFNESALCLSVSKKLLLRQITFFPIF